MTRWRTWLLPLLSAAVLFAPTRAAALLYVHPARGQSPRQEESDKGECYDWAVQQRGDEE